MKQLNYKLGEFGNLFKNRWCITPARWFASDAGAGCLPPKFFIEKAGEHRKFYTYSLDCVLLDEGKTLVVRKSSLASKPQADASWLKKEIARTDCRLHGITVPFGGQYRQYLNNSQTLNQLDKFTGRQWTVPYFVRTLASSSATHSSGQTPKEEKRKDISTADPFEAPTYNIPEKPVTFTEGASYTVIILAGLGIAGAAAYAVFKELIFQPKEYKIFGKALERVQNDSRVKVRIGSPITGYGQESRNRAARQRIPNRTWTDEDGVERVEVNFYIRGPHGAGKVYSEMFKDKNDKQWKFTYLIVDILSPTPAQLMLESYVPA